jgi:hypothetical protein
MTIMFKAKSNMDDVKICVPNDVAIPATLTSPKIVKARTARDEDLDRFLKLLF